jgi:hypothetical protein
VLDEVTSTQVLNCTQIGYHVSWPSGSDPFYLANPTESTARVNYYGVTGVPQVEIDGVTASGALEAQMLARRAVPSPLAIELSGQMFTSTTGEITANIANTSAGVISGRLHFVLVEDNIPYHSAYGENWRHVMRDFFPGNTVGETISVNPGDVFVRTEAFTLAGTWNADNLIAIAFVQNDATKEVYQTGRTFFDLDSPELAAASNSLLIDDTVGGNGNGYLEPGESASISFGLLNLNPPTATSVVGTLTSENALGTVTDASGTWPDIAGDGGAIEFNAADPFVVSADASTTWGFLIPATLDVAGDGCAGSFAVTIPVGAPGNPIGPDGSGYFAYEDSDNYAQSPAYNWVEINPNLGGPGTLISLSDDTTLQFDLPFTFKYYGTNFTRVSICSNGWVAMGNTGYADVPNAGIPAAAGPANMIAPFWDDLDPSAVGSGKAYRYFDATNHLYIVEYSGVELFDINGQGLPETFEVILYDPAYYPTPTGDGEIVMQYALVNTPTDCTVGIENAAETVGIQYLYNGTYSAAATSLVAGRAIRFTTRTPSEASAVDDQAPLASRVTLRATPNPALAAAQIRYDVPAAGDVTLRVFDLQGAVVRTLLNGRVSAGPGMVEWDGRNDQGHETPAGVYFFRLSGPGFDTSRKIVRR